MLRQPFFIHTTFQEHLKTPRFRQVLSDRFVLRSNTHDENVPRTTSADYGQQVKRQATATERQAQMASNERQAANNKRREQRASDEELVARDERQLQITTDREKLVAGNRAMSQGTEGRQRTTGQMASNGKRRIAETVSR